MTTIQLRGTFMIGENLKTANLVASDLASGISTELDGHDVEMTFVGFGEPSSEHEAAMWVNGFELSVSLADVSESSQRLGIRFLFDIARRAADVLRVTQPTSGMPGTPPRIAQVVLLVDGLARNLDFDWHSDYRPSAALFYGEGLQPDKADMLRGIRSELSEDWDLDTYIGQALFMTRFNSDSNPSLALFLAALCCEVKIKRALRANVATHQKGALDLVVPETRAATEAIPRLYSSVATRFWGRSLKKDRPILFAQLVELFEMRNRFAHGSSNVSIDSALSKVVAARKILAWVDSGYVKPNYKH
jgi:hypothetical protein